MASLYSFFLVPICPFSISFPAEANSVIMVWSLTLNLEANSWKVRYELGSMISFKSSFFGDIGCPIQGLSSQVSLSELIF